MSDDQPQVPYLHAAPHSGVSDDRPQVPHLHADPHSGVSDDRPQVPHLHAAPHSASATPIHHLSSGERTLNLCLMNARSVCNKTHEINEFVLDKQLDVLCITETWLKGDVRDGVILSELVPHGFKVEHVPRALRGGGVGMIYKDKLSLSNLTKQGYTSFEFMDCQLNTQPTLRLVLIYRPPASAMITFVEEFEQLLDKLTTAGGELLILGDFNVHFEDHLSQHSGLFRDILSSFGLAQHVVCATHQNGHVLDMLITKDGNGFSLQHTVCDEGISDHYVILCEIKLNLPRVEQPRPVKYRSLKRIDGALMIADILYSPLSDPSFDASELNAQVDMFNHVLAELLEKHAPLKSRVFPQRQNAPWYTDEIRASKQLCRRCERQWRKTGLQIHKDIYLEKKRNVNSLILRSKSDHFLKVITEHDKNPKKLFQVVDKLLGSERAQILPPDRDPLALAEEFSAFFTEKVEAIRARITNDEPLPDAGAT